MFPCMRNSDLNYTALYRKKDSLWKEKLNSALDAAQEFGFIRTISVYGAAVLSLLEQTEYKNDDEWFPKELRSNVEQLTKDWLKNNNIYYDEIAFDVKDKGTYCLSHSIDIMIEDDPVNLDRLIGNTNIIVFDYPYNCDYKFKDLTRAFSWYDIYYKYSLMKNRLS